MHELQNGFWVDSKTSGELYRVHIVPMAKILNRMKGEWADVEKFEHSVDFLFNSCNHKKLNTKIKARNLRHNMANLEIKLKKVGMLYFGVVIANTADEIAFEENTKVLSSEGHIPL